MRLQKTTDYRKRVQQNLGVCTNLEDPPYRQWPPAPSPPPARAVRGPADGIPHPPLKTSPDLGIQGLGVRATEGTNHLWPHPSVLQSCEGFPFPPSGSKEGGECSSEDEFYRLNCIHQIKAWFNREKKGGTSQCWLILNSNACGIERPQRGSGLTVT